VSKQTLTDVALRALKSPAKGQVTVWDRNSPIGVRISSGGGKTFVVMVGSGQRHTIGKVGILSLVDARTEARRILAEKTLGVTQQSKATFGEVLPKFLADQYGKDESKHKAETKRLLEKHFLPPFEQEVFGKITDQDIAKELAKIDSPSTKLHAFRSLRTMFNWAKRPPHRYVRHSPLDSYLPPGKDGKRKRILSDDEVVKVWRVAPPPVQLLYLWGTRRGETSQLSHNWIGEDVVTIPGEYTKNGRAHAIPIFPIARSILDTLPARE
jgi:hypothetical protein